MEYSFKNNPFIVTTAYHALSPVSILKLIQDLRAWIILRVLGKYQDNYSRICHLARIHFPAGNQKSRKFGVFNQKLEGNHSLFVVIWINVKANDTIICK